MGSKDSVVVGGTNGMSSRGSGHCKEPQYVLA